jgi:hypothetical protein
MNKAIVDIFQRFYNEGGRHYLSNANVRIIGKTYEFGELVEEIKECEIIDWDSIKIKFEKYMVIDRKDNRRQTISDPDAVFKFFKREVKKNIIKNKNYGTFQDNSRD